MNGKSNAFLNRISESGMVEARAGETHERAAQEHGNDREKADFAQAAAGLAACCNANQVGWNRGN